MDLCLCQVMVRTSNLSGKICDIFTRIKETAKCIVPDSVCLLVFFSVQKCRTKRVTQIQIINTLT